MGIKVGIDASRNRSGGARAHIIGIITALNGVLPKGVDEIHVWSYDLLLSKLPDYTWLKKHTHESFNKGLASQLIWQYFNLCNEAKRYKIDIMLNTDAGTVSRFKPSVTMSRDMLSYEKGEMERFGISLQRLRLIALKYVQNHSLRKSASAIFLTKYAAEVIQKSSGKIKSYKIIPHGISENFKNSLKVWKDFEKKNAPIRCIYVSNVAPYKHQIHVAKAIWYLKNRKHINISITFVGGGEGFAQDVLNKYVNEVDPESTFITQLEFVNHNELPNLIKKSDLFIFASSCENMPNTLIEGMCSGLPIACSNRGPMPEVLQDGGCYFNPEEFSEIAFAIEKLIKNEKLRTDLAVRSLQLSHNYSWHKCSLETFDYLVKTYENTTK